MTVVCAQGASAELPKVLASGQYRHVFLVTGGESYTKSGAKAALDKYLDGYSVTRFSDVEENPTLTQLEHGLARYREIKADIIIGVGGGSVIDMAKLIKIFAVQSKPPAAYIEGTEQLCASTVPLVAIPTTAGSGSEATQFAVIYVDKTKFSIAHPSILPDAALVDPGFLNSVPQAVAASSGLDALNQGIESYWSIHSTDQSKKFAREAIERAWHHLRNVVHRPDAESRLAMATAAHRAGEAINITRTTAPHAVSYPITTHFGVPHGHAVGLVLARIMLFNASVSSEDSLDARGPDYVKSTIREIAGMLGELDALGAARAYNSLMDTIGLSRSVQSLGITTRADLETIISHGFNPARVNNNPRKLTESSLREMLCELQDGSDLR